MENGKQPISGVHFETANNLDELIAAFEEFELPVEDAEVDVEDAFGDHDVEYWVWDGNRLIPASPQKLARIREVEAAQLLRRLQRLELRQQQRQRERDSVSWPRQMWGRIANSLRARQAQILRARWLPFHPRPIISARADASLPSREQETEVGQVNAPHLREVPPSDPV